MAASGNVFSRKHSRLEVWRRILRLHRPNCDGRLPDDPGLFNIIGQLHSAICGSSELGQEEDLDTAAAALQARLDMWEPSCKGSEDFDTNVERLVRAVLKEYKLYKESQRQ